MKIQKKNRGGGGWGEVGRSGAQGGCERRIEVFVKIPKKKKKGVGRVGGGGRSRGGCEKFRGGGGQGGCEQRTEIFENIQIQKKKIRGGGGGPGGPVGVDYSRGGVLMDAYEELKLL